RRGRREGAVYLQVPRRGDVAIPVDPRLQVPGDRTPGPKPELHLTVRFEPDDAPQRRSRFVLPGTANQADARREAHAFVWGSAERADVPGRNVEKRRILLGGGRERDPRNVRAGHDF